MRIIEKLALHPLAVMARGDAPKLSIGERWRWPCTPVLNVRGRNAILRSREGRAMDYRFGDYSLDTERYELRRSGTLVKLRPRVFEVLAYLIAHRDRLVSKQ